MKHPSTSTLTVRRAEKRDLPVLADYNCRLAWETEQIRLVPAQIQAGVAAVLEGRTDAFYLVVDQTPVQEEAHAGDSGRSLVVAQLMLTREWSDWRNGWFFWIQSVYVAESHRRRGIFRRLLTAAQEYVTAQPNSVGLRLYVEEDNLSAQKTYARLGLQATGYRVLEWVIAGRDYRHSNHERP